MEPIDVKVLHASLLAISDGSLSESFFFKDIRKDSTSYRLFGYHIASYSDFLLPGAFEGRGILFRGDLSDEGKFSPESIACLPPRKFFNLFENPFTTGLDPKTLVGAMNKEDGSLISTFLHEGQLALKSKTSLDSDQVKLSWEFLNNTQTGKRKKAKLEALTKSGYTVNCELVSPANRVVLAYETTDLVILNLRENTTGREIYEGDDQTVDKIVGIDWVEQIEVPKGGEEAFLSSVEHMEGIEGFVLKYKTEKGIQLVKLKTSWYQHLHHNKDSVNIPRRLFEAIIDEVVDDLKSLFHDDPISIKIIEDMENKVIPKFNHIIHQVETFVDAHKDLDRKNFAIKGQLELGILFHLAITKYLGKPVDYKEFAKKNIGLFGIKETQPTEIEE